MENETEEISSSNIAEPDTAVIAATATATLPDEEKKEDIVFDDIGDGLEEAYSKSVKSISDGQLVKGRVVRIEANEVLLDVGHKSEGVISLNELAIRQDLHPRELVSLGEELEVLVVQKEDREGRLLLSRKRAEYEKSWNTVEEMYKNSGVIKGVVIEVVKGGLIVDIGLRGFLPASLVGLRRISDLDQFMGQDIEAKILELDRIKNNVVLSRKAWLEESLKEERESFMENLLPGETRKGIVSSVVEFGVFVDLGGMDGLVHVSELSWKHIDHPSEVVSVGDEIEVRVLGVDADRERIALSLKATQQGLWADFAEKHQVGELVYGRVNKLVPFGAFIQVGDDVEGLVHISELSSHRVEKPEELVTPGEELWVKIIEIDVQKRRISLSIKQAQEAGIDVKDVSLGQELETPEELKQDEPPASEEVPAEPAAVSTETTEPADSAETAEVPAEPALEEQESEDPAPEDPAPEEQEPKASSEAENV